MEEFNKYLPWIIGAVVLIYLFRKSGSTTRLAPQTQIVQTPQPDPYAESRLQAFQAIVPLGLAQLQAGVESERNRLSQAVALRSEDVELARVNAFAQAAEREANLNYFQREQDRQLQSGAIDRYYSSRNLSSILSSVNTALSSIFRPGGGGTIFGTPPTFPRLGGFF